MERLVLLSIKTKYANQIFEGIKKYEYRRKSIGQKNLNKPIFIYSSGQEKAIVGYIIIDKILEGNKTDILNQTNNKNAKDIIEYFSTSPKCYAYHIKTAVKLKKKIPLSTLKQNQNFTIPQFYRYIYKKESIYYNLKEELSLNKFDK